jgi:tripartite-type tricarboxylate transporter receptor subunit TctC
MRTQGIKDKMRGLDLEVREMSPAEFSSLVRADYGRWGPVIRASGFKGDAP